MATKDLCLSLKGSKNTVTDSNNQYSNLNLNQNNQRLPKDTVCTKSVTNDTTKVLNYEKFTDNSKLQNSTDWHKSNKNSVKLTSSRNDSDKKDNPKNSSNNNNSTLSLHITAYENSSAENTVVDFAAEKVGESSKKKNGLNKKWKNSKQQFLDGGMAIQNPFEFPRQQESQEAADGEPEITQFRASQQILNLNSSISPVRSNSSSQISTQSYNPNSTYDIRQSSSNQGFLRSSRVLDDMNESLRPMRGNDNQSGISAAEQSFNPNSTYVISQSNNQLSNAQSNLNETGTPIKSQRRNGISAAAQSVNPNSTYVVSNNQSFLPSSSAQNGIDESLSSMRGQHGISDAQSVNPNSTYVIPQSQTTNAQNTFNESAASIRNQRKNEIAAQAAIPNLPGILRQSSNRTFRSSVAEDEWSTPKTMWITARSLYHQLSRVLTELDNEPLSEELVKNLKDNILHIKNPLTNKPKNPSQRALCAAEKTVVLANGQKFVLNQVISDEAKILSDLFEINEIDAVELILTGELQTRNYNTLPRGLCAVVCYYEAHRHYILVLKMLLRLKSVADDLMPTILVEFVDSLLKDRDLFKRVLFILQNFTVKSEFERLQKPAVNGLGTLEHQHVLTECIEDITKSCYEILCIFCHNSPTELHPEILELLFSAIKVVPLEQDNMRLSVANMAIWTSILVFINPTKLKHSPNIQQIFEIFQRNLYIKWNNPTVCASIAFCFSIAVRCARNYPGGFRNQMTVEESKLLDTSMDNCALQFIRACVVEVPDYSSFEVTIDIVDSFIKSFLCYFADKNQEMFNVCEDELLTIYEADEDYLKKPNLYYLKFLDMVTYAYAANTPKIVGLCEQFTLSKYTPLINFLTTVRDIRAPKLFVPYIEMLTKFCKTERVAHFIYQILTGDERQMATWDRLFSGLSKYLNDFNGKQRQFAWQMKAPTAAATTAPQKITATELAGILTFLRLAKAVAEKSDVARIGFYESHRWNIIDIATGMLIEPFPPTLKGELYEFLAALAIDERASMRIWSALIQKRVCTIDNKVLHGIQEEFQKEKVGGVYNCTMGFLKLVSRLLSRKNVPTSKELTPFLQFITGSVMTTFSDGKFSNTDQLYVMLTLCIDSLYQLIRHFYITTESVANNKTQVYVLGELLNDTELSRTILLILTECSNRLEDYSPKNELREKLSLSCLRLLAVAVAHRQSFIVAIRKAVASKLVATLEKLFLSPLAIKANTTYLNILMSFVSTSENMIKHTFFVIKILRELSSQRPSLQTQLVSVLFPHKELYQSLFTRLTSVYDDEIAITPNDIPLFDLPDISEATKTPRLRGEIARLIIEIFVDSLEADPTKPNLTYLFCGFDLNNIGTSILTTLDTVGEPTSCLQSFISIIEIFIAHSDPFNASFAALFEPCLRLFLRMLSFKTESSAVMLRYLRVHHDLIYQLTTCPTFLKIDYIDNVQTSGNETMQQLTTTFIDINQPSCTDPIFRRAVQGIILQLAAIELTSLLGMGQTSEPQKYYASLFAPAIQHVILEDGDEESNITIPAPMKQLPLIWALLENSKADCDKLPLPALQKFDDRRVDEILEICLRDNGIGVEQYDVLYLQFLLTTEIDSIISAEMKEIEMECKNILRYCTRYNARRLVEASCVHLLSGWVAVMNTLAFFAPVNFIDVDTQRAYLVDALFLILKYTGDIKVNDAVAAGISNTVYRLVTSISELIALDASLENRRLQLGVILTHLFNYLISSEYAKCVPFKLDLYGSIMKIFTLCCDRNEKENEDEENAFKNDGGALASILKEQKKYETTWGSIFTQLSENVIRGISEDINFAPFQLKIVAGACLTEILREDSNQHVAQYFVKSGNVNSILSGIRTLKIDFNHILDKKNREACSYFTTIMSLFTRLASSNCGWNALVDYLVVSTISSLKFWKDIPRGFFTGKDWKGSVETPEGAYVQAFDSFMQFCLAMGSNPYWRTISCPLLEAIERNQELTNQLIRTHPTLPLTKTIALLVFYIHSMDDNAKGPIETTKCLNDLLLLHTQGAPKTGFELTNLPTRSAFNLPLNLFAKRS